MSPSSVISISGITFCELSNAPLGSDWTQLLFSLSPLMHVYCEVFKDSEWKQWWTEVVLVYYANKKAVIWEIASEGAGRHFAGHWPAVTKKELIIVITA